MPYGQYCRSLSKTQDQSIHRNLGTRTIDEFVAHMVHDAATPAQLEALAFQFLCSCRTLKTRGFKDGAARWKQAWRDTHALAEAAYARLAAIPSRATHPGFFDNRSVGRPGCLDSDLHLPLVMRLDLGRPEMFSSSYQTTLKDGAVYRVVQNRDVRTWIRRVDGVAETVELPTSTLRMLLDMGRIVALPLSAIRAAA